MADPKTAADWFQEGEAALALSASADTQRELREDRERALHAFEQALALDPACPGAQRRRGAVLAALDRHEEAADAFVSAASLAPGDLELKLATAASLEALARPEAALEPLDAVLALEPLHPEALFRRAKALTALRRDEAALAAWQQVLALDDNRDVRLPDGRAGRVLGRDFRRSEARATVAQLLCRLGRPEAKQAWRALLEADADALVGFSVSPVFLDALRRYPACREAYEAHVAAHASDPHAWRKSSEVWALLGDRPAALEAMRQAVALAPTSGQLWFSLGECYASLERFTEAAEAYQRALQDPNGPSLAAKQRLELIRTHGVAWKT